MKNMVIGGIAVILLALGGGLVFEHEKNADEQVVCTKEAMQCSDGSYVGRTGPKCEFACPSVSTTTQAVTSSNVAALGQTIIVNGISITPLTIIEESRCPTDVQCIQAGTIRVETKLESASGAQTLMLKLGTPITFSGKKVTLSQALPIPNTKVPRKNSDYRFTYTVSNAAVSKTGILKGNVTIGPVCPVETQNALCKPTAEMYAAAKVFVYTENGKTLLKTLIPDASGNFSTTLNEGKYYIDMFHQAIGGTTGVPATVTIVSGKPVVMSLHVDTGIR